MARFCVGSSRVGQRSSPSIRPLRPYAPKWDRPVEIDAPRIARRRRETCETSSPTITVDLDHMSALDLDCVELLVLDDQVLALGDLVAAAFMLRGDRLAGFLVDELLAQPIVGYLVNLPEGNPLRGRAGCMQRDRARDQRQQATSTSEGTGSVERILERPPTPRSLLALDCRAHESHRASCSRSWSSSCATQPASSCTTAGMSGAANSGRRLPPVPKRSAAANRDVAARKRIVSAAGFCPSGTELYMIFQRDSSCPDSAVRVRPPQPRSQSLLA
jgi:hypothetical protein